MKKDQENNTEKQKRTQEFSERRALFFAGLEVLKAKRNFLFLTLALAASGTLIGHYFHETAYSTNATLFVQALEEPTAAEYLLNQHIGRTGKAERVETYMRYLSSDAFFVSVAQKMKFHSDIQKLNLKSPQSQSVFSLSFWKRKLIGLFATETAGSESDIANMSLEELVGSLKGLTTFETDYSHFIHVKTKALDPHSAQIVANLIAEEFVSLTNERGIQEIEHVRTFVQEKITETLERIKKTELELIEFKKKNSIISTDTSSNLIADRYTKIASDLEAARLQYEENQKLLQFFEKGQQKKFESTPTTQAGTQVYGAKETAMILQRKIEQLKKEKGLIIAQEDKNQEWRLKELDVEINKTLQAFKVYSSKMGTENLFQYMNPQKIQTKINELKEENEILRNKIATHTKAIDEVKSQIQGIPFLAQKQMVLENDLRLDNEGYSNLKNKLTELEIQRISQKKEVRLDQMASFPGPMPRGNLALKLIFSSLIALLLGVSIIIGIEVVDPTVKHRSDLSDCGIEFIGEIPLMEGMEGTPSAANAHKIMANSMPESIESMAFKYIRARLESYKYKFKKDHLVISISSSAAGEGKSFISANLAASIASLKRSVLLIDCDLRRPSQNAYFEVAPQHGLVDLLHMNKSLDEVLLADVITGLDYLPAGFCKENPTELISSEKFRALISFLKPQYDYIVIDTPPVFAAVDSSIIAGFSDIPILIANFRETKKFHLNECYTNLLQVSYKKVYGIINKAIIGTTRFHYYGYHTYAKDQKPVDPSQSGDSKNASDVQKFLDNLKKKSS